MIGKIFLFLRRCRGIIVLLLIPMVMPKEVLAQSLVEKEHHRGKLWETVRNDGWVGSLAAWDFLVSQTFGLFPGFDGYVHPCCDEFQAVDTYSNANMHNFRSGCWIVVKDMLIPGAPPVYSPTFAPYEVYTSGLQEETYGVSNLLEPLDLKKNYIESPNFNPNLPEEMTEGFWYTNTGIRVTRRSYVWSFPGYQDFIIYDYIFKHTGEFVSTLTGALVPNPADSLRLQTLRGVYFVFHSGISVSTKSPINFHCELFGIAAGAFGWQPPQYHDYYHIFDNGELVFSTNFNGGKNPHPNSTVYCIKPNQAWKQRFGNELFSPAGFGWLALYADSLPGQPARLSPKPDVLRIDSHKGGTFQGVELDLQGFRGWATSSKARPYLFAITPDTQAALGNNGDRLNFCTMSYGPYTLAPGDSVRIILAEIAGVMDYNEVNAGDPNGHFPDSTIAAVRRNADNARNAVRWGRGATINGIPLAADVPEPPPGPVTDAVNASIGIEKAIIGVTWERTAETAILLDGSGAVFYDGSRDLVGYRVYRSTDFQYTTEGADPVLRGAAWQVLADIPRSRFTEFFDATLGKYRYNDTTVIFGFRYGYYVSAYRNPGASWTSANGTVVTNLPELASGDYNRTLPASASPGPVSSFDIFVAPNPYVYNDLIRSFGITNPYKVEFRNLPERCTIRVYSLMGDLVRTIEHQPDARGNVSGSEPWDQKSNSGLLVAPGFYIYQVESKTPGLDRSFIGKLMIIR